MKDVQAEVPKHQVEITQVGIKNLRFPIKISLKKNGNITNVEAKINFCTNLQKDIRGTNMSRFIEILMNHVDNQALFIDDFVSIIEESTKIMETNKVFITLDFGIPVYVTSPRSRKKSIYYSDVRFEYEYDKDNDKLFLTTSITQIGTALCPCSKEISEYGAHNQRSNITLTFKQEIVDRNYIWIEDILEIINDSFSCRIYPLLKRPDEKYVTERAYENPKFVEDIARELLVSFKQNFDTKENRILGGSIIVENEESIHLHNAYCKIVF